MAAGHGQPDAVAARRRADRAVLQTHGVLCVVGLPGSGRRRWAQQLVTPTTEVLDYRDAFLEADTVLAATRQYASQAVIVLVDRWIRALPCVTPPMLVAGASSSTATAALADRTRDDVALARLAEKTGGNPHLLAAALDATRRYQLEDVIRALGRLTGTAEDIDGGVFARRVLQTLGGAPTAARDLLVAYALDDRAPATEAPLADSWNPTADALLGALLDHGWLRPDGAVAYRLHPALEGLVFLHPLFERARQEWVHTTLQAERVARQRPDLDRWLSRIDRLVLPWEQRRALLTASFEATTADDPTRRHLESWLRNRVARDPAAALVLATAERARSRPDRAVAAALAWVHDPEAGAAARVEHARSLYALGRVDEARTALGAGGADGGTVSLPALRFQAALALASDDLAHALALAQHSIDLAVSGGDAHEEARGLGLRAAILVEFLDLERAHLDATRALRELAEHEDTTGHAAALLTLAEIHLQAGRPDACCEAVAAVEALLDTSNTVLLATGAGLRALAALEIGDTVRAQQVAVQGQLRLAQQSRRTDAWLEGIRLLGHALDDAQVVPPVDAWLTLVNRFVGMPDLRLARLFAALAAAATHEQVDPPGLPRPPTTSSVGRMLQPQDAHRSVWARLATRLRRGALARVFSDGRRFTLSNGTTVELGGRRTAQRLLAALAVAARAQLPGVGAAALIEAVWPNDRSTDGSLRARLQVAVSELRRVGLRAHIETLDDGYALTDVHIVSTPSDSPAGPTSPQDAG